MKLTELTSYLLNDAVIEGDKKCDVTYMRKFDGDFSKPGGMTFALKSKITFEQLTKCRADVIITDHEVNSPLSTKAWIVTKSARLQMAKLSHLFAESPQQLTNADYLNPDGKLSRIHLSGNVQISSNVYIGDGAIIYSNVSIYNKTIIGNNCIIHSNSVLGSDGFGSEKDENGDWFKIAHLGGLILGKNVEIGAGTCIDRGTLGDTEIGDNVMIDNLVHVAHNVRIGRNTQITAQAMIAGSCVIGKNVWLSPGCLIREGITVGDDAFVGIGSVVTKDVETGTRVAGAPARKI